MKNIYIEYMQEIGMTKAFVSRVNTVMEYYRTICPEEITDIFVTDYITEEGKREYRNLWFFSLHYMMEAKQFLTEDDFDVVPFKKHIARLAVERQNLSDATEDYVSEKARMQVSLTLDTDIEGALSATRNNCRYLQAIVEKCLVPNLIS